MLPKDLFHLLWELHDAVRPLADGCHYLNRYSVLHSLHINGTIQSLLPDSSGASVLMNGAYVGGSRHDMRVTTRRTSSVLAAAFKHLCCLSTDVDCQARRRMKTPLARE